MSAPEELPDASEAFTTVLNALVVERPPSPNLRQWFVSFAIGLMNHPISVEVAAALVANTAFPSQFRLLSQEIVTSASDFIEFSWR
jgi:hypothetical protein